MIETKEQYEQQLAHMHTPEICTLPECNTQALQETIEALREVARAANELREAMAYNKGTGETKKRLENAYGALWQAKNALPDWLKDG